MKDELNEKLREHPKLALLLAFALGAVLLWFLWCNLPKEVKKACDNCGAVQMTCRHDSVDIDAIVGSCPTLTDKNGNPIEGVCSNYDSEGLRAQCKYCEGSCNLG